MFSEVVTAVQSTHAVACLKRTENLIPPPPRAVVAARFTCDALSQPLRDSDFTEGQKGNDLIFQLLFCNCWFVFLFVQEFSRTNGAAILRALVQRATFIDNDNVLVEQMIM